MKIGVTGTRNGMSLEQMDSFLRWMRKYARQIDSFHHGVCRGVDREAECVVRLWWHNRPWNQTDVYIPTEAYPAPWEDMSWFKENAVKQLITIHPSDKPTNRNKAIVNNVDKLLAFPKELLDPGCGGTWHTIRYAESVGRPITFFWPNGAVTNERFR